MTQAEDGRQGWVVEKDGDRQLGVLRRVSDAGFMVKRDRLLQELHTRGGNAGISIVCAPEGFGKTALLLQYGATVQNDVSRGVVRIVDAASMDASELGRALRTCGEELEPAMQPLVVIDDLPALSDEEADQVIMLLRALRERGFEIVVSCTPDKRSFMAKLGDSAKIGSQTLAVHPNEYAEWARTFSISNALDVYELTQGVPALVVELQQVTGAEGGLEGLGQAAADLYRSILKPLRAARDPLYRLCCFFILLGKGTLTDFERSNMRVRNELLGRVQHDYPVFGYDAEERSFSCLNTTTSAMACLRKEIAKQSSSFGPKAVRMLMRSNRVDEAVRLAEELLDTEAELELIAQFPTRFAVTGNAAFVHKVVSRMSVEEVVHAPVSIVLSEYLCALEMGEYRTARAMCSALQRRAYVIEPNLDPEDWTVARAFSDAWKGCAGTVLPQLSEEYEQAETASDATLMQAHLGVYHELVAGTGNPASLVYPDDDGARSANRIEVPRLLLSCDKLLDEAIHGDLGNPIATDQRLQDLSSELLSRHLAPLAARVRMVAAVCRLLSGLPMVDERAFNDAGNVAVRESDLPTQLFCLLGEGWQALSTSQLVNARFRAQQVLKLADESQGFLRSWAVLLERASYLLNTSKVTICEEAEALDVSKEVATPAEAWSVALHLSAARFDSELSAWYSLHKDALLDERFRPMARLAMDAVGERADSIRALLPRRLAQSYLLVSAPEQGPGQLFEVPGRTAFQQAGQVDINLLGGLQIMRNGHVLTDELWRRKKASILAARLALSLGTFVSRRTITEELWPGSDYARARESLYVTVSTLRAAFGQQSDGPQYVLTQGEGLALNSEFVASDTATFDLLARDILLKRTGISGPQIVEACLKMEQLYVGPLYVPDVGDGSYFLRMRRRFLSKFIDCMLRGIDVAIAEDNLNAASWMAESALQHAPEREDVVRHAMRVYDMAGRQREVVEIYNSHLYYLEHELHAAPDDETRRTYEEIVEKTKSTAML